MKRNGCEAGGEILSLASWTWVSWMSFLGQSRSASLLPGPGADDIITDGTTPRVGDASKAGHGTFGGSSLPCPVTPVTVPAGLGLFAQLLSRPTNCRSEAVSSVLLEDALHSPRRHLGALWAEMSRSRRLDQLSPAVGSWQLVGGCDLQRFGA
jgi:hypothetical protein